MRTLIERDGSDLHIKVGSPPMARIQGHLQPLDDTPVLEPEDTEAALEAIIPETGVVKEFADVGEADFSYALPGASRFRVNAFRQRGSVSIAARAIPFNVRSIDDLNLPPVVRELAQEQRGIVLLTGTTGSGKSTTLAAMIDHINTNYAKHIITLEDPIEYLHPDKKSIVNQREVGADTESFGRAMRRVLRQDPDVILIGEMRDEETVRTALSAAETGHLVFSTVHTLDATETINRIIDFFPPHLQHQARVMLASTLRGAISQRLVPNVTNDGRVAVSEIMVVTGRVQDLILNPMETGKISEVIAEGEYYGMRTFDQALLKHVMSGEISEEVAMDTASSPHDFKLMLAAGGQKASGLEQMYSNNGDGDGEGEGDSDEPADEPTDTPTRPPAAPVQEASVPPPPPPPPPVAAPPPVPAPPPAPAPVEEAPVAYAQPEPVEEAPIPEEPIREPFSATFPAPGPPTPESVGPPAPSQEAAPYQATPGTPAHPRRPSSA